MSVGKRVLHVRNLKGLTQVELGRRSGLATSYVSRIENERVRPTMTTLGRVATALGVSISELIDLEASGGRASVARCPVSHSGKCIGEMMRSKLGPDPVGGASLYGPKELRILRLTDEVVFRASSEQIKALEVILEALITRDQPSEREELVVRAENSETPQPSDALPGA